MSCDKSSRLTFGQTCGVVDTDEQGDPVIATATMNGHVRLDSYGGPNGTGVAPNALATPVRPDGHNGSSFPGAVRTAYTPGAMGGPGRAYQMPMSGASVAPTAPWLNSPAGVAPSSYLNGSSAFQAPMHHARAESIASDVQQTQPSSPSMAVVNNQQHSQARRGSSHAHGAARVNGIEAHSASVPNGNTTLGRFLDATEQRRLFQSAVMTAASRPGSTPIQVLMQEGYLCADIKYLPDPSLGGLPDGNAIVSFAHAAALQLPQAAFIPPFAPYGADMGQNVLLGRAISNAGERPSTATNVGSPQGSSVGAEHSPYNHVAVAPQNTTPRMSGLSHFAASPGHAGSVMNKGSSPSGPSFYHTGPKEEPLANGSGSLGLGARRSASVSSYGGTGPHPPHRLLPSATSMHGPFQPGLMRSGPIDDPDIPPLLGGPLPERSAAGTLLTRYNTRVIPLPTDGTDAESHASHYAPLTETDEQVLLQIMRKDIEYQDIFEAHQTKTTAKLHQYAQAMRPAKRVKLVHSQTGLHWWERSSDEDLSSIGKDHESFRLIFPTDRRRSTENSSLRGARIELDMSKAARRRVAQQYEDVVPIRLEIDVEPLRLRDTFLWNAADDHVSAETFAAVLCDDLGLPAFVFAAPIRESVQSQIQEHSQMQALRPKASLPDAAKLAGAGVLGCADRKWWEEMRDKIISGQQDAGYSRRRMEDHDGWQTDLRIPIKLDITVGGMQLVDQFEWDISDEENSPELFADTFAADLGLAGEFKTAIAHSIREQVETHIRSLTLVGYAFDGSAVVDDELRTAFLPALISPARSEVEADNHTPRLSQLTEAEIDRIDREREREARRKRRQTRGRRGVTLPDREPLKTQRTPAVYGLQNVSASESLAFSMAFNNTSAPVVAAPARRAAAIAAAASIGPAWQDMNGTPPPVPELPALDEKRLRVENYRMYFKYPGGLGRRKGEGGSKTSDARDTLKEAKLSGPSASGRLAGSENGTSSRGASTRVSQPLVPGQHPNWHDGVWHCSNCGIPEGLAPSRRKGPIGDKSLCGPCGKSWHKHRRVPAADYTRDFSVHQARLSKSSSEPSSVLQGTNGTLSVSAPGPTRSNVTSAGDSPVQIPPVEDGAGADESIAQLEDDPKEPLFLAANSSSGPDALGAPLLNTCDDDEDAFADGKAVERVSAVVSEAKPATRPGSPDLPLQDFGAFSDSDSDSDSSDSMAAPRKKPGIAHANDPCLGQSAAPATSATAAAPTATIATAPVRAASPEKVPAAIQDAQPPPPAWLEKSAEKLRGKYPHDRFEIYLRPKQAGGVGPSVTPEWRMRCLDCPGKLYTPGPGESLNNFEIHLKNRAHRAAVAKRRETQQQEY
ncbi:SNF5-domain-containing protein [Tilletiaria anomala UBC 951]|uniref:SNF5-domain-containing protein n=1 Tax=Tilletiaria anomala (strain ATCC 24038 / CBS 436.72 / UBC 951) TaxID=1037660 RepID=A0A066W6J9_TILAU|nr:SNF5-domain-containing protein [Tilletiaria anomala UBC 951]KDN48178.1 SNF5-domain-containing protein [Tilletiaria anomala UBC 951]